MPGESENGGLSLFCNNFAQRGLVPNLRPHGLLSAESVRETLRGAAHEGGERAFSLRKRRRKETDPDTL